MAELQYLVDEFRAEGLPIGWINPTWETYGRPYPFSVRGSIAHHTASPTWSTAEANRNVVMNGNSVAPGPIAHCLLQRSVRLDIIAAGRCNHAGGGWWPLGKDTGNAFGFAIESVNDGVGEFWRTEFVEVMARAYAVVHRVEGIGADLSWCHSAYAPSRKIDPAGPAAFRSNRPGTWTNAEWQSLLGKYINISKPPQEGKKKMERLITYFHGRNYPPSPHWGNGQPITTTLYQSGVQMVHVWSGNVLADLKAKGIPEEILFPDRKAFLFDTVKTCATMSASPFDGSREGEQDLELDQAWRT